MSELNIKCLLNTRNLSPEDQKRLLKNNILNKVKAYFDATITEKPYFLNGCISCQFGKGYRDVSKHYIKNINNSQKNK